MPLKKNSAIICLLFASFLLLFFHLSSLVSFRGQSTACSNQYSNAVFRNGDSVNVSRISANSAAMGTAFSKSKTGIVQTKMEQIMSTGVNHSTLSNCTLRHVRLSPVTLPLTGLISYPGSGNTWTRHLIQQITGIGTSSMFCDEFLRHHGFPFECERQKNKTIVVKSHSLHTGFLFEKVILLVRNPYDCMLSFASLMKVGHTENPSVEDLKEAVTSMFDTQIKAYTGLITMTVQMFHGPVYVLQYEKLNTDTEGELTKLVSFLNVDVTQNDIKCAVKHQEGNFHRRTNDAEHRRLLGSVFSMHHRKRMREAGRNAEQILKQSYNVDIDLSGSVKDFMFNQTSNSLI